MRRLDSIDDQMRGIATYEFADGRRILLSARDVEKYGAANVIRACGHGDLLPDKSERLPVVQCGRKIGTVPADFDPTGIRSESWLYAPRRGDFVRDGDQWIACKHLGSGDLTAVAGFVWDEGHARHKEDLLENSRSFLRAATA